MKRLNVPIIFAAMLFSSHSLADTFTATQECPYAQRIKQLSNSNLSTLDVGTTYQTLTYNNAAKDFVRIRIDGVGDKWTKTDCGTVKENDTVKTRGDGAKPPKSKKYSRSDNKHVAGQFDYYKLALSYSPEFCLVKGKNQPQCSREWIVHGLWPQYNKGYPGNCDVPPNMVDSINKKEIFAFMPSDYLISHEWKKHGTCSGLSRSEYYDFTGQLWDSLSLPDLSSGKFSQDEIRQAVIDKNPRLEANMIELACDEGSGPKNTLDEIRICFSKEGIAEACTEMERSCGKNVKVRAL
ncbi:ribonuclease T2 family protein [Enterovibrio norvegicus]|uniref:Uncharacterized protein n=1 Tax=Enterovibrio norvegicus TaxID=188144 RepID=A0A2N7LGZ9_9GAMM|nr:hypothetical protein [Enterovibrio norvegicus]PMN94832.1 hypothetical protein BCT23_02025 [Enterovibrio norvegicus]